MSIYDIRGGNCLECEKWIEDYDPKICCNGGGYEYPCGCMGQPTEPAICSQECWDAMQEKSRLAWEKFFKEQDESKST